MPSAGLREINYQNITKYERSNELIEHHKKLWESI